ncbi:MAG TPA: hypothetical protein DEV87_04910 [Clostridiales bacterium]|nr:hypothetical protein [Clostridiales bacterium]
MIMEVSEKIFAANVKTLRKAKKLSQSELAEKLNFTEKAVSKWECGEYVPSIHVLFKIAEEFGVSVENLFEENSGIYFLGIDGGGTKTSFLLTDELGNRVRSEVAPGCNPFDIGEDESKKVLSDGIRKVCGNVPFQRVVCFAGIAGGTVGGHKKLFANFLKTFGFKAAYNGSDNENVVCGGLGADDGVTLITGTGVCAYVQKNRQIKRVSGWGYFFDEGGSAFNFGREAISFACGVEDGRFFESELYRQVKSKNGESVESIVQKSYDAGKKYVASFADCVFKSAAAGDEAAAEIIKRNTKVVAGVLETCAKVIGTEKVKTVIAGGLTKESAFINYIKSSLSRPENFEISVLSGEPVEGAVRLAEYYYKKENENANR